MARGALNNPYYPNFNVKKISKAEPIEYVNDLVDHALGTQTNQFTHNFYKDYKPEEIAIKSFVKHMGPELTGPNFNQSDVNTVEALAKRAKHQMFGADEEDTKNLTEGLLKDED
jgi:hypothetical protein